MSSYSPSSARDELLADENIDSAIIDWLREQGYDVSSVAEMAPSISDETVLRQSRMEGRVLITSDLDFGDMVIRKQVVSDGVLLLRYRAQSQLDRLRLFESQWSDLLPRLPGAFVVATDSRIRVRRIQI